MFLMNQYTRFIDIIIVTMTKSMPTMAKTKLIRLRILVLSFATVIPGGGKLTSKNVIAPITKANIPIKNSQAGVCIGLLPFVRSVKNNVIFASI